MESNCPMADPMSQVLDDATIAAMSSAAVFDALFAPGGPGMTPQPSDGGDAEVSEEARLADVAASMAAGMRGLAAAEERAGLAVDAASSDGTDGEDSVDDDNHDEVPAEDDADDAEAADDTEGMGYATGTAEGSWGGGEASEWALTAVKRRRKARGGGAGPTPAELAAAEREADEDRWEYLCEWRGYGSATWERRGFLLDLGFGPEVRAYDAAHVATQRRTRAPRPQMPPGSSVARLRRQDAKIVATREKRRLRALTEFAPRLDMVLTACPLSEKALFRLLPRTPMAPTTQLYNKDKGFDDVKAVLMHIILTLNCAGIAVDAMTFLQPTTLRAVVNAIDTSRNESVLVYHGTRAEAVGAISRVGLVVPGEGNKVKVANGSAFGVGIYTDTDPHTPFHFASGGDLFVCIGRKDPGSPRYKIFASSKDVAPFLHLRVWNPESRARLNFDVSTSRFNSYAPVPTLQFMPTLQSQ